MDHFGALFRYLFAGCQQCPYEAPERSGEEPGIPDNDPKAVFAAAYRLQAGGSRHYYMWLEDPQ